MATTVEEFFEGHDNDINQEWRPLPPHNLEQSPCYAIIGNRKKPNNGGLYYCKLHPHIVNVSLESIEHHCKYDEPELHKLKILEGDSS